jgi:hypothetical protein
LWVFALPNFFRDLKKFHLGRAAKLVILAPFTDFPKITDESFRAKSKKDRVTKGTHSLVHTSHFPCKYASLQMLQESCCCARDYFLTNNRGLTDVAL